MSTRAKEHDAGVAPDDTPQLPSERKGGDSVTEEVKHTGHLAPRVAPWEPPPYIDEDESPSMRGPGAVQHDGGEKRGRRNASFPDLNITATAANLGITKSHLAKVLSGENKPSIDLAIALARTLGVPLEVVVGLYKYRYMHAKRGK